MLEYTIALFGRFTEADSESGYFDSRGCGRQSDWKWTHPSPTGASGFTRGESWTASFSGCAPVCQWNRLPKELRDDITIDRTFQRWVELDVLERIWAVLVEESEELGGVDWEWQAADCAMGWARFGGFSRPQSHGPGQGRQQAKRNG